ncbi:hypothetical protein ACN4EG_25225 [Alkalinema pantanalense CENA528]|uniref:hypothetical protein n=1 Tax=Alkalinema pantanalense TaxID=1620705 RepID=UPI003D6FF072
MERTTYRLQIGSAQIDIPGCYWLRDAVQMLHSMGINHKPTGAWFLAQDGQWYRVADMALRGIYRNTY